ncbi:amino acid ABC transporter permease [Jatrophihabitans endophyticus]|uniref:amino acid ABC transporter permease n=1 Tax=Jatrophihabitans endophyticus TaxID=1206085 RepID=UPI0009334A0E
MTTTPPTRTDEPVRDDADIDAVPLRRPGRWIAAVVVLALVALFVYGVATNDRFRWDIYSKYVVDQRLSSGAWVTLQVTFWAMVIGIGLGSLLAVMRLTDNPVLKSVSWTYVWIFRGTPVYVQLVFWGLFGTLFPNLRFGVPFGPTLLHLDIQNLEAAFFFACVGLGLNEAGYMAEIVRAGITSVGEGQSEAATALGMSWSLTMRRVVLPQAMRVIIPPTGNEVISMLKTASLVVAIPLTSELYYQSRQISAAIFQPVPLLLAAATWYLAITSVFMVGQYFLEKRFSRGASRTMTDRQLRAMTVGPRDETP